MVVLSAVTLQLYTLWYNLIHVLSKWNGKSRGFLFWKYGLSVDKWLEIIDAVEWGKVFF